MHIVVLGGGSTGEHFVGALRRLDHESEITLVERRLVGGECSYWACMPTKTMLRAPELVAAAAPFLRCGDRRKARSAARLRVARRGRRARRHLAGRMARRPEREADPRRRRRSRAGHALGRRRGAAVRPARDRDWLVAGDPADRGARLGRLLDERRSDRDARGARAARWCSAAARSAASSRSSSSASAHRSRSWRAARGCSRAWTPTRPRSSRKRCARTASTSVSTSRAESVSK